MTMTRTTIKQPSIRQAIVTKYINPTNTRGARIKATAQAGSVYIGYDEAGTTPEERHAAAAAKLAAKFGWNNPEYYGPFVAGALPDGSYVHVEMPRAVPALHDALGNLLQLMAGNRGDKAGNPYSKPEVRDGLAALYLAAHGHKPDNSSDALNSADAWRGTRYKVTVRSNDGMRRHHEYMTIHEGQNVELEAARFASSYGATVEAIEKQ
jgi:hypothetical protein